MSLRRGRSSAATMGAGRVPAVLVAAIAMTAAIATLVPPAGAAKGPRRVDVVWTHPDFAKLGVASIAFLPVASFENVPAGEKQVEAALGAALRNTGYRWVSGATARAMLQSGGGGDSLPRAVKEEVLKNARVDSLDAPRVCALLRTRALLCVRLERWEQVQLEWDQSGKPSTVVQLRAALVDSSGRLLWSASGSELVEGSYHDARSNPIGVKSSGLGTQPVGGESAAPSYDQALAPLVARWAPRFPVKPTAASPSAAPVTGVPDDSALRVTAPRDSAR